MSLWASRATHGVFSHAGVHASIWTAREGVFLIRACGLRTVSKLNKDACAAISMYEFSPAATPAKEIPPALRWQKRRVRDIISHFEECPRRSHVGVLWDRWQVPHRAWMKLQHKRYPRLPTHGGPASGRSSIRWPPQIGFQQHRAAVFVEERAQKCRSGKARGNEGENKNRTRVP